jgi:hypothetical protein
MNQLAYKHEHFIEGCEDGAPLIADHDGFPGLGEPSDGPGGAGQFTHPFAFGAVSYFPGFFGQFLRSMGLQEKGWSCDHALAHPLAGSLVMVKEKAQIPCRDLLPDDPIV